MAKLFVFGIGGTGSRVLRSLSYLLASGIEINTNEIIPIIIDPDVGNGDLKRTLELLATYGEIRSKCHSDGHKFFKTAVNTLGSLKDRKDTAAHKVSDAFQFGLEGVKDQPFQSYIGHNTDMDEANEAMASLLFSEDNMKAEMDVGFKGNPNIGSVVLNQFKESEEYITFASNFAVGDRIFIVSSIFGGTGAAGFPLLLKNLREANKELSNHDLLRNAPIGAISVLPYFGVAHSDDSEINKGTFISKTRGALSYYNRNVTGNKSLNAMYYIGDNEAFKDYMNVMGSENQKNDAHLLEVLSALAIVDFASIPDEELKVEKGDVKQLHTREFGVKEMAEKMHFRHFTKNVIQIMEEPMTKYMLMVKYLNNHRKWAIDHNMPWTTGKKSLNEDFFKTKYYSDTLTTFNNNFIKWLEELKGNKRSFEPFNLDASKDNLFTILNGIENKESRWPWTKDNYTLFEDKLNSVAKKHSEEELPQQLMTVFNDATEELYNKKFHM